MVLSEHGPAIWTEYSPGLNQKTIKITGSPHAILVKATSEDPDWQEWRPANETQVPTKPVLELSSDIVIIGYGCVAEHIDLVEQIRVMFTRAGNLYYNLNDAKSRCAFRNNFASQGQKFKVVKIEIVIDNFEVVT